MRVTTLGPGYVGGWDDFVLGERAGNALEGANALAVVTQWREFRSPDFEQIRHLRKTAALFDGRNIFDRKCMGPYGVSRTMG